MDAYREIETNSQVPADAWTPVAKQFSVQFEEEEANDHQMPTTLPIQLTNAIGTHLDHLNEDCILEIFSKNPLTVTNLLALAETCRLFKRIVQRLFPKSLNVERDCHTTYFISSKDNERKILSAHDVERIFKNFGSSLVALKLRSFSSHEISLVAKNCVAGTLKELEMEYTEISHVVAVELKPIFRELQKLTIRCTSINCGANLFVNCDSLIELSVDNQDFTGITYKNFPKLQRFTFEKADFDRRSKIFNFLERHKTLKFLRLDSALGEIGDFLQELSNSCKELEELEMKIPSYIRSSRTLQFSNFYSLKRLKLRFICHRSVPPCIVRFQNAISLQALEIGGLFDPKNLMADLSLLKNLRELTVNFGETNRIIRWIPLPQLTKLSLTDFGRSNKNAIDIIRQLSNLEELEILVISFVLSEEEFYEIVKLVEGRANVLKLKCQFKFRKSSETRKKIC